MGENPIVSDHDLAHAKAFFVNLDFYLCECDKEGNGAVRGLSF